jgi:hypothetical protein
LHTSGPAMHDMCGSLAGKTCERIETYFSDYLN